MKELTKVKPFKMIGSLYFVGSKEASSHLISTEEGLILIDTGYEESAEGIIDSIRELGFDTRDIKIILHSHGHGDHTQATPKIKELAPEAKAYLSFKDLRYVSCFTPDCDIQDGDRIKLGNTEILCLHTPGHTEGSCSFFFDVTEEGKTYRAGMLGGAGVNQLKKAYMNTREVSYLLRGEFFKSIERLLEVPVDVMLGNHTWHNKTLEKAESLKAADTNPFIDRDEWAAFLKKQREALQEIIASETKSEFINYAHRGAPSYCPENTMLSFYTGIHMGANGIETDVQRTKDGVLVLFHDGTLDRVCGVGGSIRDYTYEELLTFPVKREGRFDFIPTLDDFLSHFGRFPIRFAIELKMGGIEKEVVDMIYAHKLEKKVTITSFRLDFIKEVRRIAPMLHTGLLAQDPDDALISELLELGVDEVCPRGSNVTEEKVKRWHSLGFNVRAWGISNMDIMKAVYDAGADGMTVNFPDRLTAYIKEKQS